MTQIEILPSIRLCIRYHFKAMMLPTITPTMITRRTTSTAIGINMDVRRISRSEEPPLLSVHGAAPPNRIPTWGSYKALEFQPAKTKTRVCMFVPTEKFVLTVKGTDT